MEQGLHTNEEIRDLKNILAQKERQIEFLLSRVTGGMQALKAKEAAEQKASFFSHLYHTVPCGILQLTTDETYSVVSVNRRGWEFYGFSSEEEYKQHVKSPIELIMEKDKEEILPLIQGLKLHGEAISYTREVRKVKGEAGFISVTMERILNAEGQEVIQAVFTDITKVRQEQILRDALAAARADNIAKDEFLSRMSHDIRTPMNGIIGMTAIGKMCVEDAEKVRECFEKIAVSSQYLLSLINNILDMSRIESGKMHIFKEYFALQELLSELDAMIALEARERKIDLQMYSEAGMHLHYKSDSLRLKQILSNLLSNAVKFTPDGGRICVHMREEQRIGQTAILVFRVEDTGIGMSEEYMKKLFHPFEQESGERARNNVGSGLGLAIVYHLVTLMNGSVTVKSKKGAGTVFTVKIPVELTDNRVTSVPYRETEEEARLNCFSGKKVLLAEDNLLNMEIACTMLQMAGMEVMTAENGEMAASIFTGQPEGTFAAVFMDIRMPYMDGLTAARHIRKLNRRDAAAVPIIAMTANAFEEDRRQALAAGMNGYVVKPLDFLMLVKELDNLI